MNYLIDTHVFLWSLFNSNKLSKTASKIIIDTDNDIYVSLISFWEITLKFNLGKILLKKVAPEDLPKYAIKMGFEILNPTPEEVSSFYKLPKDKHKDPFDRLIIWQCICSNFTLISKDAELFKYNNYGLNVIW